MISLQVTDRHFYPFKLCTSKLNLSDNYLERYEIHNSLTFVNVMQFKKFDILSPKVVYSLFSL